jgi:hypothetical protein
MTASSLFAICWLTIGLISAYDTYWIVKNQEVMLETEQNPVGRAILQASDGDVSYFVTLKMGGTIVALGFLVWLYSYYPATAFKVIVPIVILQIMLFVYLTGHPNYEWIPKMIRGCI